MQNFCFCRYSILKLTNVQLSKFIHKYTYFTIPDQTTLRKNYLKRLHDETILKIVSELINQYLWISIDETANVANVVIGILSSNDYEGRKKFLLNMAVLEK